MKVNNHISYLLCLFCRVAHNNILGFLSTFLYGPLWDVRMFFSVETTTSSTVWHSTDHLIHSRLPCSLLFGFRLTHTHTRAHCTNEKQTLRRTAHKYESFERVRNPDRNHMMCICYACIVLRASTLVFPAYLSRRAHTPSNKMEYERRRKNSVRLFWLIRLGCGSTVGWSRRESGTKRENRYFLGQ